MLSKFIVNGYQMSKYVFKPRELGSPTIKIKHKTHNSNTKLPIKITNSTVPPEVFENIILPHDDDSDDPISNDLVNDLNERCKVY